MFVIVFIGLHVPLDKSVYRLSSNLIQIQIQIQISVDEQKTPAKTMRVNRGGIKLYSEHYQISPFELVLALIITPCAKGGLVTGETKYAHAQRKI